MEEVKLEPQLPKMREIVIHTDGSRILVVKDESSSMLEFAAILQAAVQQKATGVR